MLTAGRLWVYSMVVGLAMNTNRATHSAPCFGEQNLRQPYPITLSLRCLLFSSNSREATPLASGEPAIPCQPAFRNPSRSPVSARDC